jgi:hypothetical protein
MSPSIAVSAILRIKRTICSGRHSTVQIPTRIGYTPARDSVNISRYIKPLKSETYIVQTLKKIKEINSLARYFKVVYRWLMYRKRPKDHYRSTNAIT